jgi:hypothetical protein
MQTRKVNFCKSVGKNAIKNQTKRDIKETIQQQGLINKRCDCRKRFRCE